MGYDFIVKNAFRPKGEVTVPWPCKDEPERMLRLFPDDVLTKQPNGLWSRQTGLGLIDIHAKEEDLEPIPDDVNLRIV
jgi:hypothetical protein